MDRTLSDDALVQIVLATERPCTLALTCRTLHRLITEHRDVTCQRVIVLNRAYHADDPMPRWTRHATARDLPPTLNASMFARCPPLHTLCLRNCDALQQLPDTVPESVRSHLLVLTMGCHGLRRRSMLSLTRLPGWVGCLPHLLLLNLDGCRGLSELPDLSGLVALEKLRLGWCCSLTHLPDSVGSLRSLRVLRVRSCSRLLCLPDTLGELHEELREIDVSLCPVLRGLPASVGRLHRLEVLSMAYCVGMQEPLPEALWFLPRLRCLSAVQCPAVTARMATRLPALEELRVGHSTTEEEVATVAPCGTLTQLELLQCPHVERFAASTAEHLPQLGELCTAGCTALRELPENLTRLRKLDVSSCPELQALPGDLSHLRELDLSCGLHSPCGVRRLPGDMVHMRCLRLGGCTHIDPDETLRTVCGTMRHLRLLDLYGWWMTSLPREMGACLPELEVLCLFQCELLADVEGLAGLDGSLQQLDMSCCTGLWRIPECLAEFESLRHLDVSDTPGGEAFLLAHREALEQRCCVVQA